RSDLQQQNVDLTRFAQATVDRLKASEPERNAEVSIVEGLTATGDSRLLAVVVENLLGNAWKFSRDSAPARIEFALETHGAQPVFMVRDNGAGFDMTYASKLFGVFQRLHTTAEFEGTGIGLATVDKIVRRHGGRIWAEGVVGAGATFYFTLNESERSE